MHRKADSAHFAMREFGMIRGGDERRKIVRADFVLGFPLLSELR